MKIGARYTLLGVFAYAISLLATLPAAQAYTLLQDRLLAPLRLSGLEGTLWSGRAAEAQFGAYRLGQTSWTLRPWALALGRLEAAWTARTETGRTQGIVARGLGGTTLSEVNADLPITDLATWLAPGIAQQLDGRLKATLSDVRFDGTLSAARGTLSWDQAALNTPQAVALGGFTLTLSADPGGTKGTLLDRNSPLKAQGVLLLKPDGTYRYTGTLTPQPGSAALAQALTQFGTADANGTVTVAWSGQLPRVTRIN